MILYTSTCPPPNISSEDDAAGGTEVVSEDVVSDVHSPDSKFTMVAVSPPCVGGEPTSPLMMSGPWGKTKRRRSKEEEHSP